jgi:APA family basic amino acid/polyamine antiporter
LGTEAAAPESAGQLRRAIGPWGSYTWGYADVGADIYVALGLVIATAQGAANVAFLFAGLIYVSVGLAYTELSAMYPLAGGGQVWVTRGLGDIFGFTAGWSVLLAFTVDIALFGYISASYFDRVLPDVLHFEPWITIESASLVVALLALNLRGARESSRLNEIVAGIDILAESGLIFLAFLFAFAPTRYMHQVTGFWTNIKPSALLLGTSLAIISFVGLESISQAVQETKRPTTVIPRTSVALILTILAYAVALSNLSLGVVPWQTYSPGSDNPAKAYNLCHHLTVAACNQLHHQHENAPIVWLASQLPYLGAYLAPVIALLGGTLLLISSNSGIFGSSRIVYAMGHNDLMPSVFTKISARRHTPYVALIVFCAVAIGELFMAALTKNALQTLAEVYAFSAAVNYLLVFVALLRLRFTDPHTPRTFRVPWNVALRRRGQVYYLPIVGVLGLLSLLSVLVMVILTNPIGRIFGPLWVVIGLGFYAGYRRRRRLPILRSVPHDWSSEQLEAYEESEEHELAEEYREALRRKSRTGTKDGTSTER